MDYFIHFHYKVLQSFVAVCPTHSVAFSQRFIHQCIHDVFTVLFRVCLDFKPSMQNNVIEGTLNRCDIVRSQCDCPMDTAIGCCKWKPTDHAGQHQTTFGIGEQPNSVGTGRHHLWRRNVVISPDRTKHKKAFFVCEYRNRAVQCKGPLRHFNYE